MDRPKIMYELIEGLLIRKMIDPQIIKTIIPTEFEQDSLHQAILELLILHHNRLQESKNPSRIYTNQYQKTIPLNLKNIGEIVKVLSKFISIPALAKHLAQFQYDDFLKECSHKGLNELERKSKGLCPLMKAKTQNMPHFIPYRNNLPANAIVGNRNWQYTRKVLSLWFEKQHTEDLLIGKPSEEEICYLLLLGNEQLIEKCMHHKWDLLWSHFYCYYLKSTLEPYRTYDVDESLHKSISFETIVTLLDEQEQYFQTPLQKTLFYLVKGLIFDGQEVITSNLLMSYHSLRKIDQSKQNHRYIFNLENTLYFLNFSELHACQEIRKILQMSYLNYLESIKRFQCEHYYDFFMPIFMTPKDSIEFYKRKMLIPEYHGYQISSHINEIISPQFISQKTDQIHEFLSIVPESVFIQKILKMPEWLSKDFATSCINHLSSEDILQKYISKICQEDGTAVRRSLKNDFQEFLNMWKEYHLIWDSYNQERLHKIYEFWRRKPYQFCPQIKDLLILPSDDPECIRLLTIQYTEMLLEQIRSSEKRGQTYPKISIYSNIIHEDCFNQIVKGLKEKEILDEFWEQWYGVILRDEKLLEELLASEVEEQVQIQSESMSEEPMDIEIDD